MKPTGCSGPGKNAPRWLTRAIDNDCQANTRPNPPRESYYRRAVYTLALERLAEIRKAIKDHDTQHTGKVYRDEQGEAIGRGKGILPSLKISFKEIRGWDSGPAALAKTIHEAKSPAYFDLLEASLKRVEADQGEQLERFIQSATARQLEQFPAIVFPPHKGNRRCRHCRKPHVSELHRFHTSGSFDRTHPTREGKRARAADRRELRGRLEEIPF